MVDYDDVIKLKQFPRYWAFLREYTFHQWIPLTKASGTELWCFIWSAPEQTVKQTIETLEIRDAIALIMYDIAMFYHKLSYCILDNWAAVHSV